MRSGCRPARRPSAAEQAQSLEGRPEGGDPVGQQVVEHGVEPLLGRIPRLKQVLVEPDLVDGPDGDVSIGVGGEQDALGFWLKDQRLGQELCPGHCRHALVDNEEGNRIATTGKLAHQLQRVCSRAGRQDAVVGAVARTQVTLDRPEHRGVVIHREDCRLGGHVRSVRLRWTAAEQPRTLLR